MSLKTKLNAIKKLTFLFRKIKTHILGLMVIYFFSVFLQLSTIMFLLPLLNFMELKGNVDVSQGYWKVINTVFSTFNMELAFYNLIFMCLIVTCLFQLFNFTRQLFTKLIVPKMEYLLRNEIVQAIFLADYETTAKFRQSYFSNVLIYQAHRSSHFVANCCELTFSLMQICFYIVAISIVSLQITMLVIPFLIFNLIFINRRTKLIQSIGAKISDEADQLFHVFYERVASMKLIKAMKIQRNVVQAIQPTLQRYKDENFRSERITISLDCTIEQMQITFILAVMASGFYLWNINLSTLLVYLFLLTRLVPVFRSYNQQVSKVKGLYPAVLKIIEFYDMKIKSPVAEKTDHSQEEPRLELDKIVLTDVSFYYQKDQAVFDRLSYTFSKSNAYAVLGPSGAGKTTLIDLILNLRKPKEGTIVASFQDKPVNLEDCRLFYLPQIPNIFEGTVKDNLLMFQENADISDRELEQALKKVNLYKKFAKDKGVLSKLEENGQNLSEGQKQRLAFARVFFEPYSLIVLDEFTSAVDSESKEIMLTAVNDLKKDSIVIFITHDKESAEIADHRFNLKTGEKVSA